MTQLSPAEAFSLARRVVGRMAEREARCEQTGLPIDTCQCFQHAEPHVLAIRRGEIGPDVDADEYALLQRYKTEV